MYDVKLSRDRILDRLPGVTLEFTPVNRKLTFAASHARTKMKLTHRIRVCNMLSAA